MFTANFFQEKMRELAKSQQNGEILSSVLVMWLIVLLLLFTSLLLLLMRFFLLLLVLVVVVLLLGAKKMFVLVVSYLSFYFLVRLSLLNFVRSFRSFFFSSPLIFFLVFFCFSSSLSSVRCVSLFAFRRL